VRVPEWKYHTCSSYCGGGKFEEKNQDLVEIFYSARILQYYHYLEIEKMVQNDMIKMQLSK